MHDYCYECGREIRDSIWSVPARHPRLRRMSRYRPYWLRRILRCLGVKPRRSRIYGAKCAPWRATCWDDDRGVVPSKRLH